MRSTCTENQRWAMVKERPDSIVGLPQTSCTFEFISQFVLVLVRDGFSHVQPIFSGISLVLLINPVYYKAIFSPEAGQSSTHIF